MPGTRRGAVLALVACALVAGPVMAQEPMTGELGRIGPPGRQVIMLGVDAPGFEALEPRERALLYVLSRAAIAGDRIFTRQVHRHAADAITLLDELDRHNESMEPATAAALREDLLRALIHHGPYDQREHLKHEPWALNATALAEATRHAERAGAKLPRAPGESTDAMLQRLTTVLMDPAVEGVHVEQRKGVDILSGSASDLYAPGVTQPMVEGLLGYWQEKLNVRFDLKDGRLAMQPFRVGGLYSAELQDVLHWLRLAIPLAEEGPQRRSLHALVDFYLTGDEALFREHSVHWLRTSSRVEYLNGFIETYLDPRGVVGSWEGNAGFKADSALIEKLAGQAAYFEQKMPWEARWKRSKVEVPVAAVINTVVETGDAGPLSAAAYNLPNYNDIRRDHGSKNVVLLNVDLARSEEDRRALISEFFPAEDRQVAVDHGDNARRWLVYMHEVIGHGSGQQDPAARGSQRVLSGRTAAALEECRADLVALYQLADPKLVEIGAFKDAAEQDRVVRAAYVGYVANDLVSMRSDPDVVLREAHRRGNHLVTQYLLDGGGKKRDFGVRRVQEGGKTWLRVGDTRKFRAGVGELLGTLQKFKSTADDTAATELFDRYGRDLDPVLKAEVVARAEPLNLPRLRAMVFPRLVPVVQGGTLVDARRVHDEDLLTQQRRFRRIAAERTFEQ